jgi:hypothetical protein
MVINHLETMVKEGDVSLAYVYFRYNEELHVRDVLEAFVRQLVERHPGLLPEVETLFFKHFEEGTRPTEEELLGILFKAMKSFKASFFVLDGLDEASSSAQAAILDGLSSLGGRVFITSRHLKALARRFPTAHHFTITAQEQDIRLCITQKIQASQDLDILLEDSAFREEAISTILKASGGM